MNYRIVKKQIDKIGNISKFSFAEMTSNTDGKTSASGTMGVLVTTVGTLCFLLGCIDKMWFSQDIDIITQSIIFVGLGVSLLGYRKFKASDYIAIPERKEKNTSGNQESNTSDDAPLYS